MDKSISFKERVRQVLITCAQIYKKRFMDHEYLICSKAFRLHSYYVFYATKDNYLHLTGVNSNLRPAVFFQKCFDGTLSETDFDFKKKGQKESVLKGTVREKIQVLPYIASILEEGVTAEESFSKGRIECSFATASKKLTLGFVAPGRARPKTLLNGYLLKNSKPVDLILSKKPGDELFSEIVLGNLQAVKEYKEIIEKEISPSLLNR